MHIINVIIKICQPCHLSVHQAGRAHRPVTGPERDAAPPVMLGEDAADECGTWKSSNDTPQSCCLTGRGTFFKGNVGTNKRDSDTQHPDATSQDACVEI